MKPVTELVNEWDAFESNHPGATIEDFCRFYLIRRREAEKPEKLFGGHIPPDTDTILIKLMGRISGISSVYLKASIKDVKNIEMEWFFFLNAIYFRQEARKSDIIAEIFYEPSTGIDILNRIKKADYISERDDPNDKRAKLVKLTPKGIKILHLCWQQFSKASYLLFHGLNADDKRLIIQLLSNTEIKHTKVVNENRNKSIDELIELVAGKEGLKEIERALKERMKKAIAMKK